MNLVENKLAILHADAKKDVLRIGKGIAKSIFRPIQPKDFEQAYLPISKKQGRVIRDLIIERNCKNIIEFGTSFGISTIYLADAARQTGGKVISTELLESKANIAKENIEDTGLSEYVKIKVGDAMKTLSDYAKPIDFLFLDGWKDLYLPLFKMLEPQFHANTIIYADNMDMADTKDYAKYIKTSSHYENQIIHNGKAFLTKLSSYSLFNAFSFI